MTVDPWTLGLQAVNVLVLLWLLRRFFWAPVAGVIAARRTEAAAILDEARAQRAEAEAEKAALAAARAGLAAERAAALAQVAEEAAAERARQLAATEAELAGLRAAAEAALAAERARQARAEGEKALALSLEIAGRLAARLDGPLVRARFRDWLVAALQALPAAERPAAGAPLTLVSAAPLPEAERAALRQALEAELGPLPQLGFADDPALIEGLELRGDHFLLRNSWQADLDRLGGEMRHDAG